MGLCGGKSKDKDSTSTSKSAPPIASIKLLLLGAGESGKSTIAKQMRLIHLQGWTREELETFGGFIHANIFQAIKAMLTAMEDLSIKFASKEAANVAAEFDVWAEHITPELAEAIKILWADEGFKEVYRRRAEYQLPDSTDYFFWDIDRIAKPGYLPSEQDVLRARVQTTGIIETEFHVQGVKFLLVDVGGQRSERKKWMYCFEDVTAVLFVVALSGFDLTLYEDRKTNRMQEALKLFHEICVSKWFTHSAMILFLNKVDLFKEKLKAGATLQAAFPDYTGNNTYADATEFIRNKFMDIADPLTNKPKEIYPHFTCATDTDNVKHVFEAVKDYLFVQALNSTGLGM